MIWFGMTTYMFISILYYGYYINKKRIELVSEKQIKNRIDIEMLAKSNNQLVKLSQILLKELNTNKSELDKMRTELSKIKKGLVKQ